MKFTFIVAGLLCLNAISALAAPKKSDESMELVPSVWAAWMRGNVVVNGQKAEIHRDSEDYFGDLALGGSLELALRNSSMVVLGVVDYFDTISSDVTVGNQAGTLETSELIGCIAVGYPFAPATGNMTFDFLVGLQTLRMDNELKLNGSGSQSSSTDVYDAVMMLRIKLLVGTKFGINIPLSLGGPYLGESDFVYDAGIQLLYQVSDKFDVRAGYRISGYDYQKDANNKWDFYQQGYTLGLGITF